MSNAGVAWVQLMPSLKGFANAASSEMNRALAEPARKAGESAGSDMSRGISDGMDGGHGRIRTATGKLGDLVTSGLAAVGVAAGALVVTGLANGLQQEAILDKFEASLGGGDGDWAAKYGEIAGDLYLEGFGESVADTAEVVKRVWQGGLLPEDATSEQIENLSEKILMFTDVMAQDMDMTTQAIQSMIKSGIADSSEEALDILTVGLQQGADKSGDLLETFQEYSTMFRDLGISAEDATGLMIQGLNNGARDADKVADALKELAIRAKDGSDTTAEGFRAIGLDAETMGTAFANGGDEARTALGQVLDGLRAIEDPAARNAAAIALFGTQAEDLGEALFSLDLDTAVRTLGDTSEATEDLASAYDNAASKIEVFKRKALDKLTEVVGNVVIPLFEKAAEVLGPPLAEAFDIVKTAIESINWDRLAFLAQVFFDALSGDGYLSQWDFEGYAGIIQDLGDTLNTVYEDYIEPFFSFIASNQEAVVGGLAAIAAVLLVALVPALWGLVAPIVAAAAPFILLAAAAFAIGYALVWAYQNIDSFRTFIDEVWPQIVEIFQTSLTWIVEAIRGAIEIATWLWETYGNNLVDLAKIAWGFISGIISGFLDIIQGFINLAMAVVQGDWGAAWDAIVQILSGVWQVIWTIIKSAVLVVWELLQIGWTNIKLMLGGIFSDIWRDVTDTWNGIVEFFRGIPNAIRNAISAVADALLAPFKNAFAAIKRAWNNSIGGFSVSIPGVLGFGGASFSIPKMHTGGIYRSPAGMSEGLALLKDGEGVLDPEQTAALTSSTGDGYGPAAPTVIRIDAAGEREFKRWLRAMVKQDGGGDVQLALGTG